MADSRQLQTRPQTLPTASVVDTARVLGLAVAPIAAQGVIARRRRIVALAGKLDTDSRGVQVLQDLRERYGSGPVQLRVPLRRIAVVLDPADAARVLDGSPKPFSPAGHEKRGALQHFQPHGVLVSRGALREERRRFNESVLDTGHPLHRYAERIARVVAEEADGLCSRSGDGPTERTVDWDAFITAWWRAVRRVVLGDAAREDHGTTDLLTRLRNAGNWSGLHPRERALRDRLRARLRGYVDRAEPGSLAHLVATTPTPDGTDPVDQIPQWLFAYDPAGAVTLRALALLAAHPDELVRAQAELGEPGTPQELPRLRAAVLESVRLWPTTPLLLRETTTPTEWGTATLPTDTTILVPTWYLHRDDRTRADADRFVPHQWLDGTADHDPALVPFSAGPARCPGRELVLFTTSTFLATLLHGRDVRQLPPARLDAARPIPRGLDPFTLRFALTAR
jgi:cytochrome P450